MVDLALQTALLILANYLLVLYLTDTSVLGPFNIFEQIRSWAGVEKIVLNNINGDPAEEVYKSNGAFWAELLSCHRCFSIWSAAILVLLALLLGFVSLSWSLIIVVPAVAGGAVFLLE